MTDQCKYCSIRGDYAKCKTTECLRHSDWINQRHVQEIHKLHFEKVAIAEETAKRCSEFIRNEARNVVLDLTTVLHLIEAVEKDFKNE